MLRRTARAVLAMVIAVPMTIGIGAEPTNAAPGDVEAITPIGTQPALTRGEVPSTSRRGEVVVATDRSLNCVEVIAFCEQFATSDFGTVGAIDRTTTEPTEPMRGERIGLSGDGCTAAILRTHYEELTGAGQFSPTSARDLIAVDICGSAPDRLLELYTDSDDRLGHPAVDFDGDAVAVVTSDGVVHYQITDAEVIRTALSVDSIHPGARPVFNTENELMGLAGEVDFDVVDIDDAGQRVVSAYYGAPEFHEFGDKVYIVGWEVGGTPQVLSEPSGLPDGVAYHPTISGDGEFVAFSAHEFLGADAGMPEDARPARIYARPWSSASFTRVSADDEVGYGADFNGDGTQLAYFACAVVDDDTDPCLPDLDSNPTNDIVEIRLAWSPVPGLAGAIEREVVNALAAGGLSDGHQEPAVSGNGRYVAWQTRQVASYDSRVTPTGNYHAVIRERGAGMAVDPTDFGSVIAGGSIERMVTVRNTGPSSLLPQLVASNHPAFTVVDTSDCSSTDEVLPNWLSPQETCSIVMRFTAPAAVGTVNGELDVTEVGFEPIDATGRLIGATLPPADPPPPALTATPDPLDLGSALVGQATPSRTVTVTNTGGTSTPVNIAITGADDTDFTVPNQSCNAAPLAPAASCTIDVALVPSVEGARVGRLNIVGDSSGTSVGLVGEGRREPPPPPPPTPEPPPSITATPDPVSFGNQPVDVPSAGRRITVTNNGGPADTVTVSLSGADGADFEIVARTCGGVLAGGASCTIDVRMTPGGGGARTGQITATAGPSSASVGLTGTGLLGPSVTASPDPIDFGPIVVGQVSEDVTVTVTNVGDDDGTVSVELGGDHPDEFEIITNTCGSPVGAGGTCSITLRFGPASVGPRAATLRVTAGSSSDTVQLSGIGLLTPTLLAAPATVSASGVAIILGLGFPADRAVVLEFRPVEEISDPPVASHFEISTNSNADGQFEASAVLLRRLRFGTYVVSVAEDPDAFTATETLLVVLADTFAPQGPTGAAFGDNQLVSRGH